MILAGGRCGPELKSATGVEFRADIPFGALTMREIVQAAVSYLGEPIVVGGSESGPRWRPAGANFVESVGIGLDAVESDTFLLATVDIPFLTEEAIRDFILRCDDGAGLNYPIIRQEDSDEQFPSMARTTLRMREGVFTGGNLAVMRTEAMRSAMPVLEKAYQARKSPLHLANMVGLSTLGRVALGRIFPRMLSLAQLELSVSRFLGLPVRAIPTPFASIGADIDTAEQYLAGLGLLKNQKSPISEG